MRSVLRAFLVCFLFVIVVFPGGANNQGAGNVHGSPAATFAQLPMAFEPNEGQADERVRFISRGSGYTLFLTSEEAVLLFRRPSTDEAQAAVVRMRFVGADPDSTITGRRELPGKSNYLMGRDPARWQTNISNFGRVHYEGVYPGIDASFYGSQGRLEYDFVVAPGVKPDIIRLGFDGIKTVAVEPDGDLLLETAIGGVRLSKPILYQETDGSRNEVAGRYLLLGNNEVGFSIGRYDPDKPLVIDPQLLYATYLSGSTTEDGFGVAVDSAGDAYVTGQTFAANFPTSFGAFQTVRLGSGEVFVTKLSPVAADGQGSDLVYSTFIGGTANDIARGVAVHNATGNACVVGDTLSRLDFPITANAFQNTTVGAGDVFMTCLNSTGTGLVYSTFLSGNNGSVGRGIAVDGSGGVYVTGRADSADFPTKNAFQAVFGGGTDVFVAKIDPSESGAASLIYSTFLGGFAGDVGDDIALDSSGAAYVTGQTLSTNDCCSLFPTRNAAQPNPGANASRDAFVAKINPSLSGDPSLVYSTFLGGSSTENSTAEDGGIAVDSLGAAYVTGATVSADFPVTASAYQSTPSSVGDAFLVKLNTAGNLFVYSTFLGGSASDKGTAVAVDSSGRAYVTGYTDSADFPTSDAFQAVNNGSPDAFVTQIDPSQSGNASLGYSSYLGGNSIDLGYGIAVDGSGNAYVGGTTAGATFPATAGAFQTQTSGGRDAFLAKIGASNSSPAATDDDYAVDEDNTLTISLPGVLTNDTDGDGDPLTAVLVADVAEGTLALNANGSFSYDPDPNFNGADTFTYLANDGTADSNVATVTITVRPVNDAPVAFDEAYTVNEDDVLDVAAPGVLANDTDADLDALTAILATDVSNGTLALAVDGSFTYTPDPDSNGTDAFTYVANDGTDNSNVATVTITVVPVNDPPVGVDDVYAIDEDQSLTVAAPGVLDNDIDVDGDALASGLAANPTNGTLDLPGDGSFTYMPDADFNGTDTFQYIPRDGTVDGNVTTVTITVRPINDAPVAADDAYVVDEDGSLVVLDIPGGNDVLENDSDVDGDALTAALTTDVSNGTLALAADGSFTYTPDPDFNGTDAFTYVANDGTDNSSVATVTITVNPVNDPPVGVDDVYAIDEDQSLTIAAPGVLDNDTDVDGDSLASGLAADSTNGALDLLGDGSFTYTPDPDFNGTDTFQYIPRDGTVDGNVTTVTITVVPINDPPRTVDDIALTLEDSPTTIDVLTNDTDPDGDPLTVFAVSVPPNGTVVINPDGTVTYTPNPNFAGADSFTYDADDGQDGRSTGRVDVTVTPVNDPPVAVDDNAATPEDTSVTIEVLLNDSDPDGDALTITSVSAAPNGTAVINVGTVIYTPNPDFNGADTFTYTISDGQASATAIVTVDVTPANDAPIAVDDSYSVNEDSDLNVPAPGVLTNDADVDGDALTAVLATDVSNGTLVLAGDGSFTYTPNPNFAGIDTFSYVAADALLNSNPATVTITVNPVNDPPIVVDDTALTLEDSPITIDVLTNDSDPDGDPLTVFAVSVPPNGTVVINPDGTVTYTPNPNFAGADSFTYDADDGQDGRSTGRVDVTVTPVNDPPVAVDDNASTPEDTSVTIEVLLNDSDPDGDALTITSVSAAPNGTAVINVGTVIYTPNPDFNGADTFTYTISDGQASATAIVTVDVTPANDAPVAFDDSYSVNEDSDLNVPAPGVLTNDSDVDGDALTAVLATDVTNGTLALAPDGSFSYTPDPNFAGIDTFSYVAADALLNSNPATVTITVNPVNDPPIVVDDTALTLEDSPITIDVLTNDTDPDGDPLTVFAVSVPPNGTVVINPDGTVTYTPNPNFAGADSFTYDADDGQDGRSTGRVDVTVTPVNDPPVAVDDNASTPEDTSVTIEVLLNDSDPDGDALTITSVSAAPNGTAVINVGTVIYTPNPDFNGADTFTYTISDGQASATATVTVDVTAVNDSPVAFDDSYSVNEDATLNVPAPGVLTNDSDVDGDALTAVLVTDVINGTLVLAGDGSFSYMPDPNFAGIDTFSYVANDGTDNSNPATVTIDVLAINDPPILNPDSATTDEDRPVTLDILLNDSDPDGDPLNVTECNPPLHGRITINPDNTITYTPDPDFNGDDSAECMVEDGRGGSATSLVTLTVTPVNDPPVAVDDNYTVNEDETLTIPAPGALGNDTDVEGDSLTASLLSSIPLDVTLIFNPDGSFTYTPPPNFDGSHSFTYVANDGTDNSNNATFTIDVIPVNDRPVPTDDSATTDEDRPVTLDILLNDSDPDGDPLNVTECNPPLHGRITINPDNTITYTPDPDFNGDDSAECMVEDGRGGSATSLVTLTVTPVNDLPVAVDDNYTVNEDATLTIPAPGVLGNDTDVEGDQLNTTLATDAANGTLTLNLDGSFSYVPNSDFNGVDAFTYIADDGTDTSNLATVTIRVNPVNDPPVATDDNASTQEDTSVTIDVLANDTDPDSDPLTITSVSGPANGTAAIQGTGISYKPHPDFNGPDSFTYTISDGNGGTDTATVNVTVTSVNDPPLAANDPATTDEDTAVTVEVLANDSDPENDPITLDSVSNPLNGTTSINPNGTILYTPNPNFNGTDSFTYTISDDQGGSATATVSVTVTPVNDPPIAGDDTATTTESTSVVINVLGNDSDVDGDTLSVTAVTDPPSGEATINTDRTITYNPDSGFTGTDAFSYTASDGSGLTTTANVTVTVNAGGIEVSIDIRPGNPNNRINLQSNGLLPVAIFSTPEFDATTIDLATVTLAGASIRVLRNGRHLVARVDRNRDGIRDLLAFFPIPELELTVQDQTAVLRGQTVDGTRILGEDSVQVSDGEVRLRNNAVWPSPLYSTLQDAVDAVRDGGTVRVLAGRYEINEPVIVEREVTLRGAGCGECQGRSGGGSGGRPRGRSTELVGPTPTTVVEADLAIGMFTFAGGGGGGGGIVGRGGGGGKIRDIALHGFDASIVSLTTSRPLSVENVLMADTTRGILWMAPAPLSVDQVTVKGVLWNGISLVGDGEFDAPYHLSNTVMEEITNIGILIVDKPGTCDSNHTVRKQDIRQTSHGGLVVIRSGVCVFDSFFLANAYSGIRAIDSAVLVQNTLVAGTIPRPDGGFGDGILVASTETPQSEVKLDKVTLQTNSRTGLSNFGSKVIVEEADFVCNIGFDVHAESEYPISFTGQPGDQTLNIPFDFDINEDKFTCGCGGQEHKCSIVSALGVPSAIGVDEEP